MVSSAVRYARLAAAAGERECMEFTEQDGVPVLRLMRPMVMREDCMKCHGHELSRHARAARPTVVSPATLPVPAPAAAG